MMCARLLKAEDPTRRGRLYLLTERLFQGLLDSYARSLQWVLRHQPFTLGVAGLTLAATIWLYVIVPKGLLPPQDTGLIIGVTDAAQSISFKEMVTRQHAIADLVRQDPPALSPAAIRLANASSRVDSFSAEAASRSRSSSRTTAPSRCAARVRAAKSAAARLPAVRSVTSDVTVAARIPSATITSTKVNAAAPRRFWQSARIVQIGSAVDKDRHAVGAEHDPAHPGSSAYAASRSGVRARASS